MEYILQMSLMKSCSIDIDDNKTLYLYIYFCLLTRKGQVLIIVITLIYNHIIDH